MTGTGDTVILHQELAYADVLPVSFRRLPGPLDAAHAAAIAERNLRMLLASAALDEHGQHDKANDDSPHAADLLRIDLKVNLLLDMVGALLAATQSRPAAVPARFNPHGIVWETADEIPPAGAYGLVEIHLRDCLVQPLSLAGRVAEGRGGARGRRRLARGRQGHRGKPSDQPLPRAGAAVLDRGRYRARLWSLGGQS